MSDKIATKPLAGAYVQENGIIRGADNRILGKLDYDVRFDLLPGNRPPRPAVACMAEAMEVKLIANDWKGGWDTCSILHLLEKLQEEVKELIEAVGNHEFGGPEEGSADAVLYEAADVGNIAMMLAERAKGMPNGPRGFGK